MNVLSVFKLTLRSGRNVFNQECAQYPNQNEHRNSWFEFFVAVPAHL